MTRISESIVLEGISDRLRWFGTRREWFVKSREEEDSHEQDELEEKEAYIRPNARFFSSGDVNPGNVSEN